ncbi:hypothetical protein LTR62_008890 [Meristemomyces frigidus]|uniref:Uncharacterized protein n=1 Tax=Meristemomyces frigidus TaxID=1508187 RepID=A0AAN7YGW0_9PEZI|nr:hypothetical protein LTR62_008890 [Meristemomyces frigidus]
MYHRFTRFRTIKTRAKLIEKYKRRASFYDVDQRPFFTPKHIRFASHFNGRGRWPLDNVRRQESPRQPEDHPEDGHELSQREKEWKEKMEYMRKHIESDPYEAVFGKRFEPFWGPLVPSWMREEMGPLREHKHEPKQPSKPEQTVQAKLTPTKPATSKPITTRAQVDQANKPILSDMAKSPPQPNNKTYASYSSSSWDSRTNSTKHEEWDSVSNELKQYVFDPVSNRMIPIQAPQSADSPKAVETKIIVSNSASNTALGPNRSKDMRSLINTPRQDNKALQVPVKPFIPTRQMTETAVSVIGTAAEALKESILSLKEDSDKRMKQEQQAPAKPPRPAALSKLPVHDVDFLTADDVRSKMGKMKHTDLPKPSSAEQKAAMENNFDYNAAEWDKAESAVFRESELDRLIRHRAKLLSQERNSFHIEALKPELMKLDRRIAELQTEVEESATSYIPANAKLDGLGSTLPNADHTTRTEQLSHFGGNRITMGSQVGRAGHSSSRLATSLSRRVGTETTFGESRLQPSLARMQPKELPRTDDLDDSGAHEATEAVQNLTSVPKEWSMAADILQANRVKRTAAKQPYPYPVPRFADDMEARKSRYEAEVRQTQDEQSYATSADTLKLEKANAVLQAEVKEQKFLMQSHENRYAHKIRSLRQELETAYKQSAVHGEKHVERIRFLETEVAKARTAAGDTSTPIKKRPEKMAQAEGDMSPDIAKYVDAGKWYKQSSTKVADTVREPAVLKAEQKARDQALVKEVREIYEGEYGVIDVNHRQGGSSADKVSKVKGVVKQTSQSHTDVGEALAEHEKKVTYEFKDDGLEARLQREEKEARGRQGITRSETESKLKTTDNVVSRTQFSQAQSAEPTIDWAEPPVYRVLAYDSGNDIITTATTTANFTGSDTPISIQQALSQLYQPARFVSHFAELQQDGWQVIYGTRDLLVFRKVNPFAGESSTDSAFDENASLVDHGLIKPKENELAQEAANFYDKYKPDSQPYDPTSIENGKLMPYENAMAQEAAHAYDTARAAIVNPIDGTAKILHPSVSTGDYASPTGFLSYERPTFLNDLDAPYDHSQPADIKRLKPAPNTTEDGINVPRVKRQEPHYTGARLSKKERKWNERHERHHKRAENASRFSGRRRGGKLRFALAVGAGFAAVSYGIGVLAELSRQERREREGRR